MYVQLDADYYDHPKTLHLMSLIGPEADTYPPRLWTWALKYAKAGVLRSNAMIEVACRWRGEPGKLATAMMAAGFVEMDGLTLHGWMERTGKDILRYEQKRASMREYWHEVGKKNKGSIRKLSDNYPDSCQKLSIETELNGTELNGTKRNGADHRGAVGERRLSNVYADLWNEGPGEHLNGKSAAEKIQAAIDVGVDPQAIETAFWDHKAIKGRKIWEVLDPLRPKLDAPGIPSMDEIIRTASKIGEKREQRAI